MSLRQESKLIDGHDIQVTAFTALKGLSIKSRLIKIISPAFSGLAKSVKLKNGISILDSELNLELIGEALQHLMENIADPKVIDLILELLEFTTYDGKVLKKEIINIEFAANYLTLYKILIFVIDANRFFGKRSIGKIFEEMEIQKMTDTPQNMKIDSIKK